VSMFCRLSQRARRHLAATPAAARLSTQPVAMFVFGHRHRLHHNTLGDTDINDDQSQGQQAIVYPCAVFASVHARHATVQCASPNNTTPQSTGCRAPSRIASYQDSTCPRALVSGDAAPTPPQAMPEPFRPRQLGELAARRNADFALKERERNGSPHHRSA
jgi:hypothetical protein